MGMHHPDAKLLQNKDLDESMNESMNYSHATLMNKSEMSAVNMPKSTNDLTEILRLKPNEKFHPIHFPLLKKYIMYARRRCNPKMSKEAADELTKFYCELRQKNLRNNGCNPVTMRQLESLARLTQVKL